MKIPLAKLGRLRESILLRGVGYSLGIFISEIVRPFFLGSLSPTAFLKLSAFLRLGYFVNLNRPASFNEYIIHRKLFRLDERASVIADKVAVRKCVHDKGLSILLNELYMVTDRPDDIDFDLLPDSFVLKANHGSGMIIIVKDKRTINRNRIVEECRTWLKTSYNEAVCGTEYQYDAIDRKIIIEKYIEDHGARALFDYKFYCFYGKVEFICLVDNSGSIPLMYVYDSEWNRMPFSFYNKPLTGKFPKPPELGEMVRIAEILSSDWDFLRVDLYLVCGRIVFGELTYSPGGGMVRFQPRRYDFVYGQKLRRTHAA